MPRKHATEDSDATATMCGRESAGRVIDNAGFDCLSCRRAIQALCFDHGVRKCKLCPPGWKCGL